MDRARIVLVVLARSQPRALKARVNPLRALLPQPAIRLRDRVDLAIREAKTHVAQPGERFDRPLQEIRAKLFVREDLADDELHDLLRHVRDP